LISELEARQTGILEEDGYQTTQPDAQTVRMSPQLRLQIAEIQREIRLAENEIIALKNQIMVYQKRVENTPKREQELISLRRDYQNIQTSYESLLDRKLEADIAVNMERKQKGEQFRIIDPAKIPQKPISPNLKKLFLFTVAAGFGIGVGIAFLLELMNTSFRKPDDIEDAYELPVLVTVPRIYKPRQQLFQKIDFIGSVATSLFAIGLFGILAVICVKGAEPIIAAVK
jgi:capsular polysaccharide biosynthesis protein